MNIVMINGSPHKKGTSALLMEEFQKGAKEKGHRVDVFSVPLQSVHPCIACDHCRTATDGCIFKDDMQTLNPLLLAADLVVFVTPLYYFGMSAQLKTVIDRFYANNTALGASNKKAILLATCGDEEEWVLEALQQHYEAVCRYLKWDNIGGVYAKGVYERQDIEHTHYPQKAFDLGNSLFD